MPKRQSRRQRGLDPDFVDPDFNIHDYYAVCEKSQCMERELVAESSNFCNFGLVSSVRLLFITAETAQRKPGKG